MPRRSRFPHPPAEWRIPPPEAEESDTRADVLVARLASEEWGVLSLAELRRCGLKRQAVSVRVSNGRLHRVHQGVYAVGHSSLPLEGTFLAAVKACGPGSVLSHFSAAALYGFLEWDDRYPEVTVRGTSPRRHPGLRVHRTKSLDRVDVTREAGIPITSPARTLADVAAVVGYRRLRRAVGQSQSLRRVTIGQLGETLARLGSRRGASNLARILANGPAPTRSELEDTVLALILSGGFTRPDVNVPLVLAGRRVVPDFRWPEQRVVIEADGAAWHDHKLAREDDAERQALLEAHGNQVRRVTWDQAVAAPAQTLRRILEAGAPRVSDSSA